VCRIDILGAEERETILRGWNDTAHPVPQATLPELFVREAAKQPDAIAVVFEDETLTYRELDTRANCLARYLRARGVGPETVVGLCLARSIDLVVGIVGILKAGGAYLPLDPDYPQERLAFMLADAQARVLLTHNATHDVIYSGLTAQLDGRIPVIVDLATDAGAIADEPASALGITIDQQHTAYIIYTSGSTGAPKGVSICHSSASTFINWACSAFSTDDLAGVLAATSICFDLSVFEIFAPLCSGGRVVLATDPISIPAQSNGITLLNTVPSAIAELLRMGAIPSSVRVVNLAGETLQQRLVQQLYATTKTERVYNLYGPSEGTTYSTYTYVGKDEHPVPIGRPIWNTQVYVLDECLQPVPARVAGELYIAGAGLARGYLSRPGLTAERFIADPFGPPGSRMYRSGDLARWRADGVLDFLGRADAQVKLRGFRIEPGEIEAMLLRHGAIAQAAVIARDDGKGDKLLIAYVVARPGEALPDSAVLRTHVGQSLPDYMVPSAFVVLDALPLTPNGKLDRAALPAPTARDLQRTSGGKIPRDDVEKVLAGIFAEVLGTAVTTRESDFFRLGGHSLLVFRVVALCQKQLGLNLSVNAIYSHPSIAGLADIVRQEKAKGSSLTKLMCVRREGPQPLTPQQYALWLELKLLQNPSVYNVPVAFRVDRYLAPERVCHALERLTSAHEVLRTRLVEEDGEPRFVFDGLPALPRLEVLHGDSRGLKAVLLRPFDLARGPLWRAALHHTTGGASVLMLVVHHIVLDHDARDILLRDLTTALADPEATLPTRAYDFFDLSSYEREQLTGQRITLERFWADALSDVDLMPKLPSPCTPCPPGEEEHGLVTRHALPSALALAVRTRAAELGTTPFHLYLAAYFALLRIYTGSDDLVVGTPLSLRDTPAAQNVVGYLLNPVPVRVRLAGKRTFRQTIDEVSRSWRLVRAHGRLPMHLVLQAAVSGRRESIGSPFQVLFTLVHDSNDLSIDGKPLERVHVPISHAKFQLFLLVEQRAEGAELILEYQRGALDPEMGARFLAHLERLLQVATEQVEAPLSQLPLLDSAELEQLCAFGNCERLYPRDSTVPDVFEDIVQRYGDATALVAGTIELSYSALDRRANAVAATLRGIGVACGDRVALLLGRGPRFVASALGVLKCGAAFVPLDPAYPPERLARMLDGLGTRVGLCASRTEPSTTGVHWLDASCADEESFASAPPRTIVATDAAYVMFTSGSTGKPKGVEVPHRAIVRLVHAQDFVRMGPRETWLHMAPTLFDASTLEIWAALLHGGRCVVLEESLPTPGLLAATIRRHNITSAWFTATLFNTLVSELPDSFAGLQQILVGGETLSPEHVRRVLKSLPGVRLVNGYGPTEATTFTCCHVISLEDVVSERPIPIGRPIANTRVYVLDRGGQPTPIGVPGELYAGGDGIALGYVGQPVETSERFIADTLSGRQGDRLYRTGDRVRWRLDGVLEYLGRFDDQIKIRGYRIEPSEIEACLCEHPDVRQAAVVPHRMDSGVMQLTAYVVPQSSTPVTGLTQQLTTHAAQRLPAYMIPSAVVMLDQLPLTPNGKLDRALLKFAPQCPAQAMRNENTLLTPVETKLLAIWRVLLDRPMLTVDDDFFAVGGDSLLALRMMSRAEREIHLAIPVRVLVAGRTIRQIASLLTNPKSSLPEGVVCIRDGDNERPLFCLPGLVGGALQLMPLATKLKTHRAIYVVEHRDYEDTVLESLVETARTTAQRIRDVQPNGPYSIIGYSYGGNVAAEVARLFMHEGERMDLLAVLDSYVPGVRRSLSGFSKVPYLIRSGLGETCRYFLSRIPNRLGLNSSEPQPTRRTFELSDAHTATVLELGNRAINSHRPAPFEQRIVLVQATVMEVREWKENTDLTGTNGWSTVCTRGVDRIQIGCKHHELLTEPYVSQLAQRLEDMFRQASRH
jgi:amino acid adenylation domain-containing protein